MVVYIDGLFYKVFGIGRYYESLVKEFSRRNINIYTCVPRRLEKDFTKDFEDFSENINPIFVNYEKFSIKGMINQSSILKTLENNVDIFFYPHVNLPIYIPNNTIVTIHDLRSFTKYWDRNFLKKYILKNFVRRAVKRSNYIVAISKTTESKIKEFFEIEENKIITIYEFVNDKFTNYPSVQQPIVREPYILFVGNRKKHKNLSNLIKAFYSIKDRIPHKLVITGARDKDKKSDEIDSLIGKLNLNNRIISFVSPDDDTVINLYHHADLFIFPSLFEGFGLPPLESITCKTPVIASNIPIFREILGEKIACFDPYNVEDISSKILYALDNKEKLLEIGRERLKLFEKEKIIQQFIDLFSRVISDFSTKK
jgi:glycosyltransferase involved in cell wall biosynthesis